VVAELLADELPEDEVLEVGTLAALPPKDAVAIVKPSPKPGTGAKSVDSPNPGTSAGIELSDLLDEPLLGAEFGAPEE
jgi:hypothetical protein